jgi:arsenical pump membrane protein
MAPILIWSISAASIALMLIRPLRVSEMIWPAAGALLLCALHLISWRLAGRAVAEGMDVYLFLTGMMLLSELAKTHGVFDWLANVAVSHAAGSPRRLFLLIYAVGTAVTIFMSNDATAVVLTPAVLTAVKRAKAEPLPYLLVCALVANAASLVLPISNPANLVVFHSAVPPLSRWLAMFALPSLASILTTFVALRWYCRRQMQDQCNGSETDERLSPAGKITLAGIIFVAIVLLTASAFKADLGLPTCLAALAVAALVQIRVWSNPLPLVREISWSILPLVAALFVIVEAVKTAGALHLVENAIAGALSWQTVASALAVGFAVGVGANLFNNLPLGLLAGAALQNAPLHPVLNKAVLIGIDLGPNLSITGSLATILWLIAIRREGMQVSGWQFFKAGMIIMPISLALSIVAALAL